MSDCYESCAIISKRSMRPLSSTLSSFSEAASRATDGHFDFDTARQACLSIAQTTGCDISVDSHSISSWVYGKHVKDMMLRISRTEPFRVRTSA